MTLSVVCTLATLMSRGERAHRGRKGEDAPRVLHHQLVDLLRSCTQALELRQEKLEDVGVASTAILLQLQFGAHILRQEDSISESPFDQFDDRMRHRAIVQRSEA